MSSRPIAAAAALGLLLLAGVGAFVLVDRQPATPEDEPAGPLTPPERKPRPPKRGPEALDPGGAEETPRRPGGTVFPRHGASTEPSLLSAEGHPKQVAGVVLDDATRDPVAGAVVRYLVERKGSPPVGREVISSPDGAFEVGLPLLQGRPRKHVRVFVRAPGYEDLFAAATVERLELRLLERRAPLRLGRIVGTVRREDRPFHGRIMVEARDAFGGFSAQWTIADEAGRFLMVGFRPGDWWFNVHGSERRTHAQLGDAGEAVIEVQVGESIKAAGDFPLDPRTREVIVASIPPEAEDGSVVRAKVRDRFFWRESVEGSQATFPALPVGLWEIVVEDGERELARGSVLVEPGEGPVTVHVRKVE